MKRAQGGFTLLEVMVATTIMAIAVTALLGGLTQSLHNAARVQERERVTALAKQQMNEILLEPVLPHARELQGEWLPAMLGPGLRGGWRARVSPLMLVQPMMPMAPVMPFTRVRPELAPAPSPGPVLDHIEFEAWWSADDGRTRRTLTLEAFKRGTLNLVEPPL